MKVGVFQAVVLHVRCCSLVRGDFISLHYPAASPLVMDGPTDFGCRCVSLALGACNPEGIKDVKRQYKYCLIELVEERPHLKRQHTRVEELPLHMWILSGRN